jgi:hypothetical protein
MYIVQHSRGYHVHDHRPYPSIWIKDIIETMDTSDTCVHNRSLYWSGTCTLIIIIKDIIETEKQSIPLTHIYMTAHCTGLVHVH